MDDRDAACAYAQADFSHSNQAFVDDLLARIGEAPTHILDLGTGPADVPVRLARALPSVRVTAVDGSPAMLEIARRTVRKARLGARIELHPGRMPGLALPQHAFDAVLCKDMLHHLPDPQVLWSEIKRLARPGAAVYVMDLVRPSSPLEAREIVERVAAAEHPLLKEDFYRSLCAAFTLEELRAQVEAAGLGLEVARAGDRHMIAAGRLAERSACATS